MVENGAHVKWLTEPHAGFSGELVLQKNLTRLFLHKTMSVKLEYFIIHLSVLMNNLFHILKYN